MSFAPQARPATITAMPACTRSTLAMAALCLAGGVHAQGYADYHGHWQGTLEFFLLDASGFHVARRSASGVELSIGPDGAVAGRLADARCLLAGSASDFRNGAHATVQLSLQACRDARLDGPYEGRLLTSLALGHASLRMRSTRSFEREDVEVSGILRR